MSNTGEVPRNLPRCFYPRTPSSVGTKPYTALATVPETITDPAIVNIFTIVPVISPSA